jgi:hypothetical protein
MFRVAVSGRREQEASFFTVILWRDQAEHAAESLAKDSRIVVLAGSSSGAGPLRTTAPSVPLCPVVPGEPEQASNAARGR